MIQTMMIVSDFCCCCYVLYVNCFSAAWSIRSTLASKSRTVYMRYCFSKAVQEVPWHEIIHCISTYTYSMSLVCVQGHETVIMETNKDSVCILCFNPVKTFY